MFRPRAVVAKMSTWVAMDMFASDPFWVNGNRKATAKAPRVMTRRLRCAMTPIQENSPARARATTLPARNSRNSEKIVPSS